MKIMHDQADMNDMIFAAEHAKRPILACIPAPMTVGKDGTIEKINPHVSRFYMGDRLVLKNGWRPKRVAEYMDIFHVKPIYYRHIDGSWRPMSEVASYYGNRRIDLKEDWDQKMEGAYLAWLIKRAELIKGKITIPSPSWIRPHVPVSMTQRFGYATLNLSTLTAYPDPDPETTTVDGDMWGYHAGGGVSATTVRNAANCDSGNAFPSQIDSLIRSDYFTNNGYSFDRFVCLFDTSGLTSGATISAAILSVYQKSGGSYNNGDNDGDDWIGVTTASPASNTNLVSDDFDQTGGTTPTEQHATTERKDISSYSGTSGYIDWAFNATGIGNVSKTGVSKFTFREGHDMLGNDLVANNGQGNYIQIWAAEQTGTTNDPKLVVTYTTNTTYNQTVAATGAGVAKVLKGITAARTTLAATGAGTGKVLKAVTVARTTLAATANGVAVLLKQMSVTLTTTAAGTATLIAQRAFLQTIAAVAVATATLAKTPGKLLASTGAGIATIVKSVGKPLHATGTGVATVVKSVGKTLHAVGQGVATLLGDHLFARTLAATAQAVATMQKTPDKVLAAVGVGSAGLTAARAKILAATATATATVVKQVGKPLSAIATVIARIRQDFWRTKYTAQDDVYDIKYPHGD